MEVAQLSPTRSVDVVKHLKSIFIPEILVTDNGPQFADMTAFPTVYKFEHATSSPRYPQSNGKAERAVQTIKNLLKKATDSVRALLAYRSTPLSKASVRPSCSWGAAFKEESPPPCTHVGRQQQ